MKLPNQMSEVPSIYGYKITALLNDDEPRLFEEVPMIRLRVGKDKFGRWCLHVHDTNVSVSPYNFNGWQEGWSHE